MECIINHDDDCIIFRLILQSELANTCRENLKCLHKLMDSSKDTVRGDKYVKQIRGESRLVQVNKQFVYFASFSFVVLLVVGGWVLIFLEKSRKSLDE